MVVGVFLPHALAFFLVSAVCILVTKSKAINPSFLCHPDGLVLDLLRLLLAFLPWPALAHKKEHDILYPLDLGRRQIIHLSITKKGHKGQLSLDCHELRALRICYQQF